MRPFLLWFAISGVMACGSQRLVSSSGSEAPSGSGSRLTVLKMSGADGSSWDSGVFHDNQLHEDCSVYPAADGNLRCLPGTVLSEGYFSDMHCTDMATVYLTGCPAPTYALIEDACTYRVYPLGGPISTIYVKIGTNCTSTGAGAFTAVSLGSEVALETFVAFSQQ